MQKIKCRTYTYSNPNRKLELPSPYYKHVIVSGAIDYKLPIKYISKLKQIRDNNYKGEVELNLKIFQTLNISKDLKNE